MLDAFVEMPATFVTMLDAFVEMPATFVLMSASFVTMLDAFVLMLVEFVAMSVSFPRIEMELFPILTTLVEMFAALVVASWAASWAPEPSRTTVGTAEYQAILRRFLKSN